MRDELFTVMLLEVNILAIQQRAIVFIPKRVAGLLLPDRLVVVRSVHYPALGGRTPSSSLLIFLRHHGPVHSVSIELYLFPILVTYPEQLTI